MRTLSPSTASIVGPGVRPLYPQQLTLNPGANSRTTGSAIRWKVLKPSSQRQGIVAPLGVIPGVYLPPVSAAVSTAFWARLAAAYSGVRRSRPAAPAVSIAAPEASTLRLEIMAVSSMFLALLLGGRLEQIHARKLRPLRAGRETEHAARDGIQLGAGQPVVADRQTPLAQGVGATP